MKKLFLILTLNFGTATIMGSAKKLLSIPSNPSLRLIYYARENNLEGIKQTLCENPLLHISDSSGANALTHALFNKNHEAVQAITKEIAKTIALNIYGTNSAFTSTVLSDNFQDLDLLMKTALPLHIKKRGLNAAFLVACEKGKADFVKKIITQYPEYIYDRGSYVPSKL